MYRFLENLQQAVPDPELKPNPEFKAAMDFLNTSELVAHEIERTKYKNRCAVAATQYEADWAATHPESTPVPKPGTFGRPNAPP